MADNLDDNIVENLGEQGFISEGTQGTQGRRGDRGPTGAQGAQGTQGAQGGKGAQGARGCDGAQGTTGSKGVQGPQGLSGEKGAQGERGCDGAQGSSGTRGLQGPQGTKGDRGVQGSRGCDGDKGAQGSRGTQGPQGARGMDGLQGVRGEKGKNGVQGAQGAKGAQGARGEYGYRGDDGEIGYQGITGEDGAIWDDGIRLNGYNTHLFVFNRTENKFKPIEGQNNILRVEDGASIKIWLDANAYKSLNDNSSSILIDTVSGGQMAGTNYSAFYTIGVYILEKINPDRDLNGVVEFTFKQNAWYYSGGLLSVGGGGNSLIAGAGIDINDSTDVISVKIDKGLEFTGTDSNKLSVKDASVRYDSNNDKMILTRDGKLNSGVLQAIEAYIDDFDCGEY